MKVNFNIKSWHARLYIRSFKGSPPSNLCPYFWKVVIALLLLPLTWWSYLFKDGDFDGFMNRAGFCFVMMFFSLVLELLGIGFLNRVFGLESPAWYCFVFAIPVVATLFFTTFVSLSFGFETFARFQDRRKEKNLDKKSGFVISFLKAKKQKICPTINWK